MGQVEERMPRHAKLLVLIRGQVSELQAAPPSQGGDSLFFRFGSLEGSASNLPTWLGGLCFVFFSFSICFSFSFSSYHLCHFYFSFLFLFLFTFLSISVSFCLPFFSISLSICLFSSVIPFGCSFSRPLPVLFLPFFGFLF